MFVSEKMNPDLQKERATASFNIEEFAIWFNYGSEKLKMKRFMEHEMYKDLQNDPFEHEYLAWEDVNNLAIKQGVDTVRKLNELQNRLNPGGAEIFPALLAGPLAECPLGNPFILHFILFISTLKHQSSPEQYEKYGKRAENFEILGTYAQTELGHGTYLRGLETRADYNRATDEFILNSPTTTAYKYWPGGLGHIVNYCIVVAQLYIDNESHGIQLFLVQVRDEQTHKPLDGMDIGEIGKKIGSNGGNNGYLGFKNVHIPRTCMLMKYAKVLPGGRFIKSPLSQLAYLQMVTARCQVVRRNSLHHLMAATIATRYSAVRRQCKINPADDQVQIMDYITQQLKVFPEIAAAIAYRCASDSLWQLYHKIEKDINAGDFTRIKELHALSCTLKASSTNNTTFGIERLRQSCGGHGYLVAANLGNIFGMAAAGCTYEGENTVLYLQVGKILIKTWHDVLAAKPLMPTMTYLGECAAMNEFPQWNDTWSCLLQALQYAATNKVRKAFDSFTARLQAGQTETEAGNNTGIALIQAAELHACAYVCQTFAIEVHGKAAASRSITLNKVLENLLELYLVHTVLRNMTDILRFISLSDNDVSTLEVRLESSLKKLRPDAVAICDGFDLHDRLLNSVLGSYDGNVYERLMESSKNVPTNKEHIPASFELYLKPLMRGNL